MLCGKFRHQCCWCCLDEWQHVKQTPWQCAVQRLHVGQLMVTCVVLSYQAVFACEGLYVCAFTNWQGKVFQLSQRICRTLTLATMPLYVEVTLLHQLVLSITNSTVTQSVLPLGAVITTQGMLSVCNHSVTADTVGRGVLTL